jgi:hypothetical protein
MFWSQGPWVDLYEEVHRYEGTDIYTDFLEPWTVRHAEECRWVADFTHRTHACWDSASNEDLCILYAIFRVTSTLLLRFQTGRADGTDYLGPPICVEGYQLFHEALGFHVPNPQEFHAFYHEICGVEQMSPESPIRVLKQAWPALMLGDMMFCRAGVTVSGGSDLIVKGIAERSKLYWTFRRKDRPYADQSHEWGSNSQWRTALRRDYQAPTEFHYNVDAEESLNAEAREGDSVEVMIELVRNRCLIKSSDDDSDLYPYCYKYVEPRT